MPLHDPKSPKLWHWQQAIGWIGFDLRDPPIGFNIFILPEDLPYNRPQLGAEIASRRTITSQALDQLLDAVQSGTVEVHWRDSENEHPSLTEAETRRRMLVILGTSWQSSQSEFRNLYFERAAICNEWPVLDQSAAKAADERCCRDWLREVATTGGASKAHWFTEAKKEWPKLSKRAFDRAWGIVASDHPAMSKAGAKRFVGSTSAIGTKRT